MYIYIYTYIYNRVESASEHLTPSSLLLRPGHLKDDELLGISRLAKSRQVCFEAELEPGVDYDLLPCTLEPNVTMGYHLTVSSPVGCSLTQLPTSGDWDQRTVVGKWSTAAGTAGGCPNNPETWSHNPQFEVTVNGAATLVGVLGLSLPPQESARLQVCAILDSRGSEGYSQDACRLTCRNTQGNGAGNDRNPARDRPHQHNRRNWARVGGSWMTT